MFNVEIRVYLGNITQVELAKELGVTTMTMSRWLTKKELDAVRYIRVKNAIDAIRARNQEEPQRRQA